MNRIPRRAFAAAAVSAAALLTAMAPASAQEALKVGATFLLGSTDPTAGSAGWALASHGIGEKLFMVDKDGKLVPELAARAERSGELEWTVTLRSDRYFSDGTPVTAAAIGEGFTNTFEKSKTAAATGGKLTFETVDGLTLKVTTEKPVPLIQALFAEWPLVAYTLNDAGEAVYTGPYAIAELKADSHLELAPNAHFDGTERSPITLRKFGDAQTMALAFEAGELDLAFGLPSEVLSRLKANAGLTVKSFQVGYQYFGFLNIARPAFSDPMVRQAVDLAIDRDQLVAAINGGQPATGAFAPYFPFAPIEPRMSDLEKAAGLLDEAGWTLGPDGMREKDGQPLRIEAFAYPQRPDLVTMLPVVKAALAKVGIDVGTQVVENLNEVAASGEFDIFLWAQHTAPSGDPAFFLNSMLRSDGPLNHARYGSDEFDAIIAGFSTSGDIERRAGIALDAQQKLFEDVPVTFLVSPAWHVGVSERLSGYEPWGSDYHVIRPDMGETR
ncbi:ABC transporter substrate-binding protein [Mesorhizobium sp. Z1-4]|uniref:ABC transporter substrate-binding protein n=1 Tax=Mesorhizobium sp. Z1-4 TaxID=2448478 RepID=UPI000FD99C7B|nr:ABC transporter substrate-binding protein [Mesorhizobium sp. Z1-4]